MMIMTHSEPNCNRGDVVLVLFPHSDLRTAKPRPALIIQADKLETGLNQVIVAMISSNIHRAGHPSRVLFKLNTPEGLQSGLLTDSVIMTDNLATISECAVDRVIGYLPMNLIDKALRHTLNL
jgi:mRNA interferase MazF